MKFARKKDVWMLLVICLAAAAGMALRQSGEGRYAEISRDGAAVVRVELHEDRRFSPTGLPQMEIQVRDGRIAVIRSDCPDQVCVRAGWLKSPGQSAACLPNRVLVRVYGDPGQGVDAVAG